MKPAHSLIILVTGLSFCSGLTALGQRDLPAEDVHATLLAGKKRSLIAYAGQDHSLTLEVRAPAVKLSDVPGFVTIDQQIVQSTLVPVDTSFDLTHNSPARKQEILTHYMNFELAYYKKKLHQSYSNLISRQIYVSTLFYNQVMDLNARVFHAVIPKKQKLYC